MKTYGIWHQERVGGRNKAGQWLKDDEGKVMIYTRYSEARADAERYSERENREARGRYWHRYEAREYYKV